MSPQSVPHQPATGLPSFPTLNPDGPHLPYLEHLIAHTPRCQACTRGGHPSRTCEVCGKPVRDAGFSPEERKRITASVLDLFPEAGTIGAPRVTATPPVSEPGQPRHARRWEDETVAEPLQRRHTWSGGEPLFAFGLGVLGGLVSLVFAIGSYVELSEGKPAGILLALGAAAVPLAALAVQIDSIRTRRREAVTAAGWRRVRTP